MPRWPSVPKWKSRGGPSKSTLEPDPRLTSNRDLDDFAGGWDLHDVRGISDARLPVEICFHPRLPGTGNRYTVEIRDLAGETVDLALRMIAKDRSNRAISRECALDSSGRAALPALSGSPQSAIQVRWVRPHGGNWMSVSD